MRVRITTERDFADSALSSWIRSLIQLGVPISEEQFKRDGYFEMSCDNGHTRANTTYEIVKDPLDAPK